MSKQEDKTIELRVGYCFHCGTYGRESKEDGACIECGWDLGTYPPEIEALIQASNTEARKDEWEKFAWSDSVSDEVKDAVTPYWINRLKELTDNE